jgi:hypothetical protein
VHPFADRGPEAVRTYTKDSFLEVEHLHTSIIYKRSEVDPAEPAMLIQVEKRLGGSYQRSEYGNLRYPPAVLEAFHRDQYHPVSRPPVKVRPGTGGEALRTLVPTSAG